MFLSAYWENKAEFILNLGRWIKEVWWLKCSDLSGLFKNTSNLHLGN